jgi:hypothetical protein
MDDAVKERWWESFLDQEEAVENLARMASVAENRCFAAFGEVTPVGNDWEDALFTIRHLVSMIDRFRDDYFAAIREGITRSPVTGRDNATEGAARTPACEMLPPLNAVWAQDEAQKQLKRIRDIENAGEALGNGASTDPRRSVKPSLPDELH